VRVAPITIAVVGWTVGTLLAFLGLPVALAGVAVALVVVRGRRALVVAALVAAVGAVAGSARLAAIDDRSGPPAGAYRGVVEIGDGWHGSATARSDGTLATGERVLVRLRRGEGEPARGSLVAVVGTLTPPRGPWQGFDEGAWLAERGIHRVLHVRSLRVVGRRGGVRGVVDRVREHALSAYRAAGTPDAEAVLGAIALGADRGLSPEARDAFRRSGLAHLLAVSGGNVALLVAAVLVLAWTVGIGRRAALVISIAAVCAYVELVGPAPSVVRAGIAGVLACAAWLVSRRPDSWHALAVGAALILTWNPRSVTDPGFQLSFAAVASILLLAPVLRDVLDGLPFPAVLRAPAAITAACTLATAPISWLRFGQVNLIASVPANLAALPSAPLLLWIGLLAATIAPLSPDAAATVAASARVPADYLLAVARAGAWLDERTAALEPPLVAGLACVAGLLLYRSLLVRWSAWPRRSSRST
jgi:competence protein ComEC